MNPKLQLSKNEMKVIFGEDIRRFRDEKCYTQTYMANQLGIGQSSYQKIEANEIKISMERLVQIANILDKPVEAFFEEENQSYLEDTFFVKVSKKEFELMEKTLIQQEKRIGELEEKILRKDSKIEELKAQLNQIQITNTYNTNR